ncbi:MAG: hypothetical protein ACD_3C00032G0001 [uncultured bacterium (gcode 4)]|uniref:Uncharacterized protein n=1 Tax=uncultured bacterium (gcode 4) TaxID=1234023 RepID=K2GZ04_9BACT|nr:MAG: hypothetical protein ACD_3C00032G0001 [uncultured bacterium (gcode 4)]
MQTNTEILKDDQNNANSAERLKKLKNEILSLNDKETKAESDKDYAWLSDFLTFIRFVLKNNPTQEEIDISKKIIEELKFVKNNTKLDVGNLKDEKEIIDDIKTILDSLKQKVEEWFKNDENKKLIETKLNENSGKPKLDMIFVWTQTEIVKSASELLFSKIEEKLKKYNLSQDEMQNISIWITQKMLDKGVFNNLSWGLSWKLAIFKDKAEKGNWLELMDEWNKAKDWAVDTMKNLEQIIDANLSPLKIKLEEKPLDPLLPKLLSNPKAIANYKEGLIVDEAKLTQEELLNYLSAANSKILWLDRRLLRAEKLKDSIFDSISQAPWFMRNWIMKFLGFLLDLPIIWFLIKWFLWKTWTKDEILNSITEEMVIRKSVTALRSFWMKYNEAWIASPSEKDPWIKILKNKDLRNTNIQKLEKFFGFCKKKGVDINGKDFWTNMFSESPSFKIKDTGWNEKQLNLKKLALTEEYFGSDGQPKDIFYRELNLVSEASVPVAPQKGKEPRSALVKWSERAPVPVTWQEVPAWREVATVLPQEIKFDKSKSQLEIGRISYNVTLMSPFWINLNIENIEYKDNNLTITAWKLWVSKSKTFSEKEITSAFSSLSSTWKFTKTSADWITLDIEKA